MIHRCKKHGVNFMAECYICKQEMYDLQNRGTKTMPEQKRSQFMVTADIGTKTVQIYWDRQPDGVWQCYRTRQAHTGPQELIGYLPEMDTEEMIDIFRWMRDIATGRIDREMITPGEWRPNY